MGRTRQQQDNNRSSTGSLGTPIKRFRLGSLASFYIQQLKKKNLRNRTSLGLRISLDNLICQTTKKVRDLILLPQPQYLQILRRVRNSFRLRKAPERIDPESLRKIRWSPRPEHQDPVYLDQLFSRLLRGRLTAVLADSPFPYLHPTRWSTRTTPTTTEEPQPGTGLRLRLFSHGRRPTSCDESQERPLHVLDRVDLPYLDYFLSRHPESEDEDEGEIDNNNGGETEHYPAPHPGGPYRP